MKHARSPAFARVLTVLEPGPLATVQDLGRPGYAALGVSRSGAADRTSLLLANRLVGNADDAAGIEVTFGGFAARADTAVVVALTGAVGPASIDGRPASHGQPLHLPAGSVLTLGHPVTGLRTYVAMRGGVDVEPVLGSRSTDTLAGLGPDRLSAGSRVPSGPGDVADPARMETVQRLSATESRLRVVLGPRDDWFTSQALELLLGEPWLVSANADRVGLRLSGPQLTRARDGELPSEGCVRGSIQVSGDGRPTIFGPDHPVTGGYPVIAVVVDSDCDRSGQARPGDLIRFLR